MCLSHLAVIIKHSYADDGELWLLFLCHEHLCISLTWSLRVCVYSVSVYVYVSVSMSVSVSVTVSVSVSVSLRSADMSIEAHVMRLSRRQCPTACFLRLVRRTTR